MLTPMDIHNKDFKRSFRGYNEDEIDDFLDQVVNDYEKLFRENDRLKEELERARKDNEQYQQLEQNLKDTLLVAQKTAEEVTSSARQNAEELRENTAKECQNMRHEAQMQAKRQLDDAAAKVRSIVAEYDRLVREKNQFLRKVKVTMESELAVINETLRVLPDPEAAESQAGQEKLAAMPQTAEEPQAEPSQAADKEAEEKDKASEEKE